MADYTNKQLATVISSSADKIQKNLAKETQIANKIEKASDVFSEKVQTLQQMKFEPNLDHVNKLYQEKTEENIKRANSRLNVPNLAFYVWFASFLMLTTSGVFLWFSVRSKQDIINEHMTKLEQTHSIMEKKDADLYKNMLNWFQKNPKSRENFINSQKK